MFRDKALVKQRSPEQIDEAFKIVHRNNRAAFLAVGGTIVAALLWGSFGHIPQVSRGQGILITPDSVVPLQAQAAGKIKEWYVHEGDFVKKGQLLGVLEQPDIEQELAQQVDRMDEVHERNKIVGDLKSKYSDLERSLLDKKREDLKKRIQYLEDYIDRTKNVAASVVDKNQKLIVSQSKSLKKQKVAQQDIATDLKERMDSYTRLKSEGLMSDDSVRSMKQQYEDTQMKIRDLDLQIQEMDLKMIQVNETHLNMQNMISNEENNLTTLQLELKGLDNIEADLDKADSQFQFQQKNEVKDLERSIEQNQKKLQIYRELRAEYNGKVLELTESVGAVVSLGQRVAQLDIRDEDDEIVALSYFQTKDGKQLHNGDMVRVSPSNIDRKKYGSIIGYVQSVSQYPVTRDSVVNHVGNSSVATNLIAQDYLIEVLVKLKEAKDAPSGYGWTSGLGPNVNITTGTSASIYAVVENRKPITYVLPKLREWLFGYVESKTATEKK